jgi:protein transport protein SEC39
MPDSKAHVVLDAVQFATEADLSSLRQLISSHGSTLQFELVLRILLTYLPESIESADYITLLQQLRSGAIGDQNRVATTNRPSKNISKDEAKRRVRKLRLLPLTHSSIPSSTTDLFERFLLCRAYRIDAELGSIALIKELIEPFIEQYKELAVWAASRILPLQRLAENDDTKVISLESLEQLHDRAGLNALIVFDNKGKAIDYSPQLRNVVGPWQLSEISYRQETHEIQSGDDLLKKQMTAKASWNCVNQWLLELASIDYDSAVLTCTNWKGPEDVSYGTWLETPPYPESTKLATAAYQQVGLAMVYLQSGTGHRQKIESLIRTTSARNPGLNPSDITPTSSDSYRSTIPEVYLSSLATVHLLPGELLDASNPLTTPSNHSIEFVNLALVSATLLDTLGQEFSVEKVVNIALFGTPTSQWTVCSKIIRNLPTICGKDDKHWLQARETLLWLRDWNTGVLPGQTRQGIFSQIDLEEIHNSLFESMVTDGRYKLAIDLYCRSSPPLPMARVKDTLISVILASYDNASNGNKTRGGIKKAADIITTFQPHFPQFQRMNNLLALIQATHRLSFYSLTLQHGVPLLPVNIRILPEPLTIIDKALKQNPRSYTKLDDLLDIGRDLVKAGLIVDTLESTEVTVDGEEAILHQVNQTIIAKSISASLSADDFDTAYSYIISRLSIETNTTTPATDIASSDDLLWRAAYQAGRYTSHTKTTTSPSSLRRLEQRMELLSQALILAPPSSLQEVLSTWRGCERDLNTALAQESREETAWQAKGDRTLPGGFGFDEIAPVQTKSRESTRRALDEEAPMGLFDVARGAAAALSKSAFPLRGSTQAAPRTSGESVRSDDDGNAQQRVRKRDMVSNMVTGGLASGIGWVIGKS